MTDWEEKIIKELQICMIKSNPYPELDLIKQEIKQFADEIIKKCNKLPECYIDYDINKLLSDRGIE